jgi:hypothetical protein
VIAVVTTTLLELGSTLYCTAQKIKKNFRAAICFC